MRKPSICRAALTILAVAAAATQVAATVVDSRDAEDYLDSDGGEVVNALGAGSIEHGDVPRKPPHPTPEDFNEPEFIEHWDLKDGEKHQIIELMISTETKEKKNVLKAIMAGIRTVLQREDQEFTEDPTSVNTDEDTSATDPESSTTDSVDEASTTDSGSNTKDTGASQTIAVDTGSTASASTGDVSPSEPGSTSKESKEERAASTTRASTEPDSTEETGNPPGTNMTSRAETNVTSVTAPGN